MCDEPVVGVLADEFPLIHDSVRRRGRTLRDRIRGALMSHLALSTRPPNVRGATVAADTLIEALLTSSGAHRCELFVPPKAVTAFSHRIHEWRARNTALSDWRIHPLPHLADAVRSPNFAALFSPSGNWVQALQIRRDFASRLYPLTAVAYGFGLHPMLYAVFLNAVLLGMMECDSIICTTRVSRDALLNIFAHVTDHFNREFGTRLQYQGRADVIPLCVNTGRLRPREKRSLRKRLGLPVDALVLLYVGRISPLKGDWLPFMRMFSELVRQNHSRNLLLVMCGTQEETYLNRLREYTRAIHISQNVRFDLDVSDDAREHLIPASDLFVCISDTVNETFGLAPVEAMACGVPQVVSDWNGYRETVEHGETGFLVPTSWTRCDCDLTATGALLGVDFDHRRIGQSVAIDMRAFRRFLQELIDNEDLRARMAARSRSRAIELYSYGATAKRYHEVWHELEEIARKLIPRLRPDCIPRLRLRVRVRPGYREYE